MTIGQDLVLHFDFSLQAGDMLGTILQQKDSQPLWFWTGNCTTPHLYSFTLLIVDIRDSLCDLGMNPFNPYEFITCEGWAMGQ